MQKKFISLLLVAFLLVGTAACGSGDKEEPW